MNEFSNFSDKELVETRKYLVDWNHSLSFRQTTTNVPGDEFGKNLCEKVGLGYNGIIQTMAIAMMILNISEEMSNRFESLVLGQCE